MKLSKLFQKEDPALREEARAAAEAEWEKKCAAARDRLRAQYDALPAFNTRRCCPKCQQVNLQFRYCVETWTEEIPYPPEWQRLDGGKVVHQVHLRIEVMDTFCSTCHFHFGIRKPADHKSATVGEVVAW